MTGSGTLLDPYIIYDVNDLQAIDADLDAYYEIANDIDATITNTWNAGAGFSPIGLAGGSGFNGHVNSLGLYPACVISNLFINRPATDWVGLFRWIGAHNLPGTVHNIRLENVNITGNDYVGALAGEVLTFNIVGVDFASDVQDCSSSGTVTGANRVGGLIGTSSWNPVG